MMKKKLVCICLVIALVFSVPFRWIQYKGEQMVTIIDAYYLGMENMFFDFSLLLIDTCILYIIFSMGARIFRMIYIKNYNS